MPLNKGQTNNPNGRPKGVKNKVTTDTRSFLNAFLKKNRRKLQADWNLLKPYERVQMFERLLSFSLPKMSSMEIERLPDDQLDQIIDKILNNEK